MEKKRPLSELEPVFDSLKHDDGLAHGLFFLCPACPNLGHTIFVPVRGNSPYKAGLWACQDERVETFTASPSIDCTPGGCKFHGFVENGIVRWEE